MNIRDRKAELEALLDEVAPAGWRADRRWGRLVTATAIFERWAGLRPTDGEPSAAPAADRFVGQPGPGPADLAGAIGWAIAAAHAAIAALARHDGAFTGQPLRVRLVREHGRPRVVPAPEVATVGFALGDQVLIATLDPRGPAHEHALARRLADHARGAPRGAGGALATVAPGTPTPGAPLAVVAIGDEPLALAHHGHRRAWTDGGGPWLGVARAAGLTVLSACPRVVDGFGHAHLAADVARGLDRGAARALTATAAAIVGDAAPPPLAPIAAADAVPLGLAWRRLPGPTPKIGRQAWALGRVLAAGPDGSTRARGATLQLAVAAGPLDDPTRFARRARTALVTVRFPDGQPEPWAGFAARAREAITDAALGRGLYGRLRAGAPVPRWLERRWLGAPGHPLPGGPGELLAGDGGLALLRATTVPPLLAAAAPARALDLPADDATAVLTVIDDGRAALATLAGRGRAGTAAGATELLDAWLHVLREDVDGPERADRSP